LIANLLVYVEHVLVTYIYTSWFTSCRHVCNGMSSGVMGEGGEEEEEEEKE
jgi:hypothetical protein